jgi:hypothetical protein
MLRRVVLEITDILEDGVASLIRVTRIGELGTSLDLISNIVFLHRLLRLLVTANVIPSAPIFVTLMMGAILSSETSVLIKPRG